MLRVSFLFVICFSLFCFISWNCTKIDSTTIGADLLPAADNVSTFDTVLSVIANNIDSVSGDCFTVYPENDHLLGCIKANPLFGSTISTIYTELKSAVYPFSFPANSTLDSIVLVLSYKASYGDTTLTQKVNVYQISGTFNPDSSSCRLYDHEASLLGSAVYAPQQLNDSVFGFREASANQLRIRLDNAFGQLLLSQDSSTAFKSDSIFKSFFKGFAITPDQNFGGNALSYFNLADTNTKLSVYYKSNNGTIDTSISNFRLTILSASANHVLRNHAGAEITNHLLRPPEGDEVIYIQTTPGTNAEIKIPDLGKISNRIIHRAILTMDEVYADNAAGNLLTTPNILYLDLHDTSFSGGFKPIHCDFNTLSGTPDISTLGGFKTTIKDPFGHNISRYTFNISRYVQKIVTNGHGNLTLRLRAPANIINTMGYLDDCGQTVAPFNYPINLPAFGQVKLGGGNNANYRMKLHIVYSTI